MIVNIVKRVLFPVFMRVWSGQRLWQWKIYIVRRNHLKSQNLGLTRVSSRFAKKISLSKTFIDNVSLSITSLFLYISPHHGAAVSLSSLWKFSSMTTMTVNIFIESLNIFTAPPSKRAWISSPPSFVTLLYTTSLTHPLLYLSTTRHPTHSPTHPPTHSPNPCTEIPTAKDWKDRR